MSGNLFRLSSVVLARLVALAAIMTCVLATAPARADRPRGVTAQTLVLPDGPASLKGLGESFEPSAATGAGSYSVPLQVPPGFLAPSPALTYSGGHGKSEVGQGWRLPVLQIYRQTDKGAPNFDEKDRFAVSGPGLNDELVLVNEQLRYYRLKNEGAFVLFVRDPDADSWTVRLPSGQTCFLGSSSESRQVSRGRAARWFIDKQIDRFGHWSEYQYFNDRGHVYLEEIAYQLHAAAEYQNTVTFGYAARPDVFTDYAYGDADTTAQRLASVQMFHGARLIRSYDLRYRDSQLLSLLSSLELTGEDGASMPKLTFGYLEESTDGGDLVTVKGAPPLDPLIEGLAELDDVNSDGLPDLLVSKAGDYRYYENLDGRSFGNARTLQNSPDHDLGEASVTFADMDGDGFRDLVHAQGDHFRYYPGGDIRAGVFRGYRNAVELRTRTDGFSFTDPLLKLGDQNHDGRIDLLWQKPGQDSWIVNGKDDVLREETAPELPTDVDFEDPRVDLTDFNGDGLLDVVHKDIGLASSVLRVWYGLGHGAFTTEQQVPGVPRGDPSEFHLRDVNHDGQADLLRISGSWATVYLNGGARGFSGARGDFRGLPATSDTQRLLFADMNGNGSTDLVWVTKDFKLRYFDLDGEPNAGLLARVDNGMGAVTEISYRSSTEYSIAAKKAGKPWIYPLPTPVPVVSEVRTSDSLDLLGLHATETRTSYDYRDGYYDGKEHEFRGFADSTVTSWGDDDHESLVTHSTFHVGRNPSSLADEEILKGKPLSKSEEDTSGRLFSVVETIWEQRHMCQEDLGSQLQVLPNCRALGDLTDKKDELVSFAVSPASLTATYERGAKPAFAAVTTDFDVWGDAIRTVSWGRVDYRGVYQRGAGFDPAKIADISGDERVSTSETLKNVGEWLIGLPVEQGVDDIAGNPLERIRTYYDELGYGKARLGLTSRISRYDVDRKRWIDSERNEFDRHGNRTASVNAAGDRSELRYDQKGNFFPDRERVRVSDDDWLTFTAEHDLGYGVIVRLSDPNGLESRSELDGLGRVVRVFRAGSSLPTSRFEYTFGNASSPVSITRTDTLVEDSGRYHSSWSYSDGMGRVRQEKSAAEDPYGFIASGWFNYSRRGSPTARFESFVTRSLGLEEPPSGTPVARFQADGLGRVTRSERPPTADLPGGSWALTEYYPFETRAYSERESTLGELKHPTITRVDGQGRVVEMNKLNVQGAEEQQLTWKVGYDGRGSIISFADPLWNGRSDDARHLRRYGYDGLGRLVEVNDPNAGRTSFELDDLGRIVKRTDALNQVQTWEFGAGGRLLVHRVGADARGSAAYEHRYHYDSPAPATPLQGAASAHLRGRLSWLEFPTGEEHYGYDERGRVTEEVHRLWNPAQSSFEQQQRDTFRRQVSYRADGQVTQNLAPGGFSLDYRYDERGHVSGLDGRLGQQSKSILSDARYDHRSANTRSDLGNGIRICAAFNQRSELTASVADRSTGLDCASASTALGGLRNLRYTRDYDGLISGIEDLSTQNSGVERLDAAYEYDSISQLVKVSDARGTTTLAYDRIQNLVKREILGDVRDEPTGAFGYGEGGAGPSAITSAGGKQYGYDAAGQMQRYNGYDLRFNAEGLLVEASNVTTGARLVQHYDDAGERRLALLYRAGKPVEVHRFVAGDYAIHDGEEVWFARTGSASVEVARSQGVKVDAYLLDRLTAYANGSRSGPKPLPAEYMDLNGDGRIMDAADLALAQQSYSTETRVGGEKLVWRFSTTDHLGSVSQSTDSAGDLMLTQRFRAYGKLATRAGTTPYRGGYLGKDLEADADLGLQRVGARYYAAELGRWVTPDPMIGLNPRRMVENPIESNLYSYSRNNPIMFRDPLGLEGKTALVVANAESTVKKRNAKGEAIEQDDYQNYARQFAKHYTQRYPSHQVSTLAEGEQERFPASQDASRAAARERGRKANYKNQPKVLEAVQAAAKSAGEGGTVVLIGHGAVGGSEALFQMGVGDTAFILDKSEVARGLMDGFLTKLGTILKAHKVSSIRFAGCVIGKDEEYANTLAAKIGVKAEFDKDLIAFGEDHTVHKEFDEKGNLRNTDAPVKGLTPSQFTAYPPKDENDPLNGGGKL